MAKYGTIRELQAKASNLIAKTENGEPLIITTHGKPVAVLTSVSPDEADSVARFMERMFSYQAFKKMQKEAKERFPKGVFQKEINGIIKKARAEK